PGPTGSDVAAGSQPAVRSTSTMSGAPRRRSTAVPLPNELRTLADGHGIEACTIHCGKLTRVVTDSLAARPLGDHPQPHRQARRGELREWHRGGRDRPETGSSEAADPQRWCRPTSARDTVAVSMPVPATGRRWR